MSNEDKMKTMLKNLSIKQIEEAWIATASLLHSTDLEDSAAARIMRGYIMDELEKRNPSAFDNWMDTETQEDENNISKYFKGV